MGKALSSLRRPLRNFNIEGRAHKVIAMSKPVPAPKHKIDQMNIDRLMAEHPQKYEESLKKNDQLDSFLKGVYVKSHDNTEVRTKAETNRPLPMNRSQVEDFEFGVKESEKIPLGKTSLKQALKFITDHHLNAKENSAEIIAKQYSLPEETVGSVLKYFKNFEIYIPERRTKAKFAGPTVPRIKVVVNKRKALTSGRLTDEKT